MPKCPQCGTRNPRENTTCRNCGAVLGLEEAPTAAVSVEPAAELAAAAEVETAGTAESDVSVESSGEETTEEEGAADLSCAKCQASIAPGQALVIPGPGRGIVALCPQCRAEIEQQLAAESQDLQINRAVLFGLGAAILSGVAWYLIVYFSPLPDLPVMAFVAGWLIAEAVRYGAGRKRGQPLQWIALGLTALTILGTEYAIIGRPNPLDFVQSLGELFKDPFTLVLLGFGLWQAYTTPRARRLRGIQR
ncbi:MAG: zinc ribbon domain-containing protein [Chloroflexia bacterium]|nr:zinc ribbon domain-containing protein [Chloroflexia bacterium]